MSNELSIETHTRHTGITLITLITLTLITLIRDAKIVYQSFAYRPIDIKIYSSITSKLHEMKTSQRDQRVFWKKGAEDSVEMRFEAKTSKIFTRSVSQANRHHYQVIVHSKIARCSLFNYSNKATWLPLSRNTMNRPSKDLGIFNRCSTP
jgi:hypothetical protein